MSKTTKKGPPIMQVSTTSMENAQLQIRKIKDSAPEWAKNAYYESIKEGKTPSYALNRLKRSPFFLDEWIEKVSQ